MGIAEDEIALSVEYTHSNGTIVEEFVDEGEEVVWHTVHFGTYEVHGLHIEYEEGQDYIDVSQTVIVQYPDTYETDPTSTS